ncbi:MAG: cbb3-type cytochrome c oxidase subunit I [Gemmatimonadetes bacterium]|jgi:cytochrome c oxidase subunit 1|nr:cbb3-type cytochrome c oxidase subunit I [Gemmatimonadota bacterium]|tara:strand:- start:6476 stop:8251 length:1776 start_codon:yes stop_codon:yes gene_type:complete
MSNHIGEGHSEGHHDQGFIKTYIFSTDHKMIAKQFLITSLVFLAIGGILAAMIRWQLGFPGQPLPFNLGAILPDSMAPGGIILPEFYNSLVTMHATFMVFFALMPLMAGVFGNLLIPLQIGADDMAFPRINMLSFWITPVAGAIMLASFFVEGGAAGAGWTSYAPLSTSGEWTGVYMGQILWLVSLIILGFSSITGALNYVTTVIAMRAPGMTWFRIPLATWSLFITAWLLLLAIPILTGGLILLLFDQTIGTAFFRPEGSGEPLMWQHIFWFFGHPEVYILILPAMGFVSEVIANRSRKPVFGYHSMVVAIVAIAFLGWIVWGHHMFQSGMNPFLGMSFMATTVVIAVPSAIKTFNWMGTLWKGDIHFDTPLLHAVSFVALFVIGGLSGIFLASAPVDIYLHDTYFIVAHLHYVLVGGSLFGIFSGITFWFPKMFGRMMNEGLGKIHWVISFIAYNLAFFPMHNLGVQGMMRRIYDPNQYEFLQSLQSTNTFISKSVFVFAAAQIIFAVNFFWSMKKGKKAGDNPWDSNGLEWACPSPPPHGNFAEVPVVHRGPYEYSHPDREEDFWPQDEPIDLGNNAPSANPENEYGE